MLLLPTSVYHYYLQHILYDTVLLFLFFKIKDGTLDHWTCLPYSVFVMVWACLTLSLWGQKASTLAYRWGMLDFEVRACIYLCSFSL